MTLSGWEKTWRLDHQRVLAQMEQPARAHYKREGWLDLRARSLFMAAALTLELKVVYATFLMERAYQTRLAGVSPQPAGPAPGLPESVAASRSQLSAMRRSPERTG